LLSVSPATPEESPSDFIAKQITIDGVPVIRLGDLKRGIEVSILPSVGNVAYEMKVYGKNILYFPDMELSNFQKNPSQSGIPFMAPWANRLDGYGFWANGKKYTFDQALGNIRRDQNGLPLHGLLPNRTAWRVMDVNADAQSAQATSRLDLWKYPDIMAQWPIAHACEMTYRLADGALEVRTTVFNLSMEAMPLAVGYHPYYRIPDVPRDQWVLHLPDCKSVVVDPRLIPTGEFKPLDLPNPLPLKGRTLDDGFTDFKRDAGGIATFRIESGKKRIDLLFGPQFPVAIIWAPGSFMRRGMDFLCVEPMAGITNGINLNHEGKYPALQTVPPNGKWTESFWIRPAGF
jgi:aldose 1-epimerase